MRQVNGATIGAARCGVPPAELAGTSVGVGATAMRAIRTCSFLAAASLLGVTGIAASTPQLAAATSSTTVVVGPGQVSAFTGPPPTTPWITYNEGPNGSVGTTTLVAGPAGQTAGNGSAQLTI